VADLSNDEDMMLNHAQRLSSPDRPGGPVDVYATRIAPARLDPAQVNQTVESLVRKGMLERDARDHNRLRLTQAGRDQDTDQNPLKRTWSRFMATTGQRIKEDLFGGPGRANLSQWYDLQKIRDLRAKYFDRNESRDQVPRTDYGQRRNGGPQVPQNAPRAGRNTGPEFPRAGTAQGRNGTRYYGTARVPTRNEGSAQQPVRAEGRARVPNQGPHGPEAPDVVTSRKLGSLAEAVINSGTESGPDAERARQFVDALFADPASSERVLAGWNAVQAGESAAGRPQEDRQNMRAVSVALDDPSVAYLVRNKAEEWRKLANGIQPEVTQRAAAVGDMYSVAQAQLRPQPRTLKEAMAQQRRCPATDAQFSQRMGDAARAIATSVGPERNRAIEELRKVMYSKPDVAKDVLEGRAGALHQRSNPFLTSGSQQVNKSNVEAVNEALRDPGVAYELERYARDQGRHTSHMQPEVAEHARGAQKLFSETPQPRQEQVARQPAPAFDNGTLA
jgi:hypothetical protein